MKNSNITFWTNPHPSSTRLCRPIEFEFSKESETSTKSKFKKIQRQINLLNASTVVKNNRKLSVSHDLKLSMVDGKVVSHLANIAFSNCNVCGMKPTQMNDLTLVPTVNEKIMSFGLSVLHCWIRFLEYMLHVAYRLTVKKWCVRNAKEKAEVLERKQNIQTEFKKKGCNVWYFCSGSACVFTCFLSIQDYGWTS